MIRTVAIDDEPFALEILSDDIQKISFLKLTATFSSPLNALEWLKTEPVDLIFLDIQMPTLTGTVTLDLPPDLNRRPSDFDHPS